MARINAVNNQEATPATRELFDAIKAKFGMVPNMMRTMAASPNVLKAYLDFSGTLGQTLDAGEREQIALAVAEVNGCDYCASAHSVIGKMAGLTPEAITDARRGTASSPRTKAIVEFSAAIARSRGQVSDFEVDAAKAAGLTEAELAEVVANVALNVFTNFFNNVAETPVDFPKAPSLLESAVRG